MSVSKQVCNTAFALAYLLILLPGSTVKSGLHSFPFLHSVHVTDPPGEACSGTGYPSILTWIVLVFSLYEVCQGHAKGKVHILCKEVTCAGVW